MREDKFTNTPEDAGLYEVRRGEPDDYDDRPTLAEAERDEAELGPYKRRAKPAPPAPRADEPF